MDARTNPKPQNTKRRKQVRDLKQEGYTYLEIGKQMNISRQRVQQLVAPPTKEAKSIKLSRHGLCDICHLPASKLAIHHLDYTQIETLVVCTSCHRNLHGQNAGKGKYMPKKMISVDTETYDEIKRLADAGHRTIGGTVAWLLELTMQSNTYDVISLSTLPHPPDATPVPLVTIQEQP